MTYRAFLVTFRKHLNGLRAMEISRAHMALSDGNSLVDYYRDFMTRRGQHNVQVLADTDCRSSLKSLSFSFRQLCITGTVFVIVMGFLGKVFLESSFQGLRGSISYPIRVESVPNHDNLLDAAPSDRSLKIFEDLDKVPSSPSEIASRESAEEDKYSILNKVPASPTKEENALTGEQDAKTTPMVRSVGQDKTLQKEEKPISDIDEQGTADTFSGRPNVSSTQRQGEGPDTNVADQSTTNSTKVKVYNQEQDNQSNPFPEDVLQEQPLETSAKDKEVFNLSGVRNASLVVTTPQSINSSTMMSTLNSSSGECDFTVGRWVHDPAGPLYRSDQCPILNQRQNCQGNGRPDHGYEFYRWEPDHCSIPPFDATAFLEMMRGKTLAFIGDSLARNQMDSLMCILLQVAEARPGKGKNMHRWYFPIHSFTVARIWSSWLVQSGGDFPPSAAPEGVTKLNLTELDDYAQYLPTFDVTILSSGHWWLRKTAYFMNGEMLGGTGFRWLPSYGEMKLNHSTAYDIALNNTLQKVGSYPGYRGLTILRTYTPNHYHGGSWNSGGSCTGETKPYQDAPRNPFNEMMHEKQINIFEYNAQNSRGRIMPNGSKLRLLDVFTVLNYRGDGHPGPYRSSDPLKQTTSDSESPRRPQDCLHWCNPGPLDTVNELLFHLLRAEMQPYGDS